jgi:hypothetical protein
MARITEPRIGQTTTTGGTGPWALSGNLIDHNPFSGVCSVNDTFWGDIAGIDPVTLAPTSEWVEGLCTYSAANEITLTTIYRSSNGNAPVTFAAGMQVVRLIADARQIAKLENFSGTSSGNNTGDQDLAPYATIVYADGGDAATLAAAKTYANSVVTGLWDDRGNFNASVNLFPSSGGSGTAGAVLKGDIWTVSVVGNLGGTAVALGDTVRAVVDTPGQTAGNWAIAEHNLGYVPENFANKGVAGGYGSLNASGKATLGETRYLNRTSVKTSSYTAAAYDLVPCDSTGANVPITLPTAPEDATIIAVKHIIQGGANVVTVTCGGADVFNKASGATSLTLTLLAQAALLQYQASTAIWTILADDIPLAQLDARFVAQTRTINAHPLSANIVLTLPEQIRASSTANIASPLAWNSSNYDAYAATAQAANLTISADAGTPVNLQKAIFRIKDDGTPRVLSWTTGSSKAFRAVGVTLPVITVANKTMYVGAIYNAADDRWDAVAVAQEA